METGNCLLTFGYGNVNEPKVLKLNKLYDFSPLPVVWWHQHHVLISFGNALSFSPFPFLPAYFCGFVAVSFSFWWHLQLLSNFRWAEFATEQVNVESCCLVFSRKDWWLVGIDFQYQCRLQTFIFTIQSVIPWFLELLDAILSIFPSQGVPVFASCVLVCAHAHVCITYGAPGLTLKQGLSFFSCLRK